MVAGTAWLPVGGEGPDRTPSPKPELNLQVTIWKPKSMNPSGLSQETGQLILTVWTLHMRHA